MAYTPTALRVKGTQSFGSLVQDQNRIEMTGAIGNTLQSQDATATPVLSPLTNGSASGFALTVPANAVQCTIYCTTVAVTLLVGEDSSYAQGMFVPATTYFTVDCARMANIYIKPSSGTNTIYFQFKIV